MVFTQLAHDRNEKEAFFSLLDEYFQSRPELVGALKSSGTDVSKVSGRVAAAASAIAAATPPPPRRTPGAPSPPTGLVSSQRIGSIDTTSKTSMVTSAFKKNPPPTGTVHAPSAFSARNAGGSTPTPPPPRRTPVVPEPEPPAGEWAEALYDYDSNDPHDLEIREGQRILVTERTSDDWWTGEVDGKSGIFPASYVKVV